MPLRRRRAVDRCYSNLDVKQWAARGVPIVLPNALLSFSLRQHHGSWTRLQGSSPPSSLLFTSGVSTFDCSGLVDDAFAAAPWACPLEALSLPHPLSSPSFFTLVATFSSTLHSIYRSPASYKLPARYPPKRTFGTPLPLLGPSTHSRHLDRTNREIPCRLHPLPTPARAKRMTWSVHVTCSLLINRRTGLSAKRRTAEPLKRSPAPPPTLLPPPSTPLNNHLCQLRVGHRLANCAQVGKLNVSTLSK